MILEWILLLFGNLSITESEFFCAILLQYHLGAIVWKPCDSNVLPEGKRFWVMGFILTVSTHNLPRKLDVFDLSLLKSQP